MTDQVYDSAYEKAFSGSLNVLTDTIKAVAVDTAAYTVDAATHEFLSDIPVADRIAMSAALTGKTMTGRVLDADPAALSGVSGDEFEAVVLIKDTGDAATSPLIAYIDSATGLPLTPNGGDIQITWDTGPNKIVKF